MPHYSQESLNEVRAEALLRDLDTTDPRTIAYDTDTPLEAQLAQNFYDMSPKIDIDQLVYGPLEIVFERDRVMLEFVGASQEGRYLCTMYSDKNKSYQDVVIEGVLYTPDSSLLDADAIVQIVQSGRDIPSARFAYEKEEKHFVAIYNHDKIVKDGMILLNKAYEQGEPMLEVIKQRMLCEKELRFVPYTIHRVDGSEQVYYVDVTGVDLVQATQAKQHTDETRFETVAFGTSVATLEDDKATFLSLG